MTYDLMFINMDNINLADALNNNDKYLYNLYRNIKLNRVLHRDRAVHKNTVLQLIEQ